MEWIQWVIDLFLHFDRRLLEMLDWVGPWTYVFLFLVVFCETGLVTMLCGVVGTGSAVQNPMVLVAAKTIA